MEHLDLPELNQINIADNQDKISTNRDLIIILAFFIIVLMSTNMYLVYKQHSLADCQVKLIEKITDQTQPKIVHELFEKECSHD